MRLSDFTVLSFDCYGTLIDWETGITRAVAPWLNDVGVTASRDEILRAFASAESDLQMAMPGAPYPEILAAVHPAMAEHFGVPSSEEAAASFGASVKDWPPFSDSVEALGYLAQHYQLVILSNVDQTSFAHSNEKLEVAFDAVFTAQDVGSYKPHPNNFRYMLDRLAERGVAQEKILHTAESLYHDHVPAKQFGLATCWIHRRAGQAGHGATRPPEVEVHPDFRFESLAAMAAAHQAEIAAAG